MVRTAGLMLLAFQAASSDPSRWVESGHSSDGTVYYVDASRSTINVEHPDVWFKVDASHVHSPPYAFSMQRVEFDCANYRMHIVSATNYDANGVGTIQTTPVGFSEIMPDSIAENLADIVCPAALRRRGAQ